MLLLPPFESSKDLEPSERMLFLTSVLNEQFLISKQWSLIFDSPTRKLLSTCTLSKTLINVNFSIKSPLTLWTSVETLLISLSFLTVESSTWIKIKWMSYAPPKGSTNMHASLQSIQFTLHDIKEQLNVLDTAEVMGPNNVSIEMANTLAPELVTLFQYNCNTRISIIGKLK